MNNNKKLAPLNLQLHSVKSKAPRYYSMDVKDSVADIYIFGDITSWEWLESDVSSFTLSKELKELGKEIETINVHINSYGGEVAEGLAIYNMLRNHKAKVVTVCEGFACSIASVIFMAGDERIMNNASLLMIHNAWMYTAGNATQLRKDADDLETITQASIEAYKNATSIEEEEIKSLLDAETWLLPSEALDKGFATSIVNEPATNKVAANVRKSMFKLIKDSLILSTGVAQLIVSPEDEPEQIIEPESIDDSEPIIEPVQDDYPEKNDEGDADAALEEEDEKVRKMFLTIFK